MRRPLLLSIALGACILPSSAFAQSTANLARGLSAAMGAQGRIIWIDGTANLFRKLTKDGKTTLVNNTTTLDGVKQIVAKCKAAHINTLVVDVKPLSGQVLYNSKIAPHLTSWQSHPVPDFDVLKAFIDEGHKAGLQVDACINILSEGHKYYSVGPAYTHIGWQSMVYTVDRGLNTTSGARLPVRVANEPADPNAPELLRDDSAVLGAEPTSGMVGLETPDAQQAPDVQGDFGKQVNVSLDADNRVTGVIDSALLGDDPLIAPEAGHMVVATRPDDVAWVTKNIKVGAPLRLDMRIGRSPIANAPSEKVACFVNPLEPEARAYELAMVKEIVSNYDLDGLVLDRCRYSNLYNDFSDRTRDAFAHWLETHPARREGGGTIDHIDHFPEDVFAFSPNPGDPIIRGPLFKRWLEFRAKIIHDFAADVAQIVRSIKPRIALGTYVGSWYPKYYEVGVNWGSDRTGLRYPWFTPEYPKTGYAEYFDWVCTGCYYKTATRDDARADGLSEFGTVEYAAELSNLAVASGAFVYGGIYVVDYAGRPDVFVKSLDAAARQTQGWMIFDISQVEDNNWWPLIEKAYPSPAVAPNTVPDLLESIRSAR